MAFFPRQLLAFAILMTFPTWMFGHDIASAHGPPASASYDVSMAVSPTAPAAGQAATVRFRVRHDGKPVRQFDTVHEKTSHLIVVSRDLSQFQHLHPVLGTDGVFTVSVQFPTGGAYRMFMDVTPKKGVQLVRPFDVAVQGPPPPVAPLTPDAELTRTVGTVTVKLMAEPAVLKKGGAMLTFHLADQGRPVNDLQPYLGAMGHLVIISADGKRFLHAHPMEDSGMRSGAQVAFHTEFPAAGLYKMWAQFQRGGKVITVPFVVIVK